MASHTSESFARYQLHNSVHDNGRFVKGAVRCLQGMERGRQPIGSGVHCVRSLLTCLDASGSNGPPGLVIAPPPDPVVKPQIVHPKSLDADSDRIDDRLETRLASLQEPVRVQLVFSRQITQEQIDGFVGLGGQIEYVYQAVSYGWNGTIPRAPTRCPTRFERFSIPTAATWRGLGQTSLYGYSRANGDAGAYTQLSDPDTPRTAG